MSGLKNIVGFLFAILLLVFFYSFMANQTSPFLFFNPEKTAEAVRHIPVGYVISTALAIMFGVVFGSLYDQLRNRQTIPSYRREIGRLLRSARFFRSFLAAPIVFVGVYLAAGSEPDPIVSLIFAFQNGFFCDAIMKSQDPTT